jgi:hypothetical protein
MGIFSAFGVCVPGGSGLGFGIAYVGRLNQVWNRRLEQ